MIMRRDAERLAGRIDQLARAQDALRQELKDHRDQHAEDRKMATSARRWYASTAVSAAGVGVPALTGVVYLILHAH